MSFVRGGGAGRRGGRGGRLGGRGTGRGRGRGPGSRSRDRDTRLHPIVIDDSPPNFGVSGPAAVAAAASSPIVIDGHPTPPAAAPVANNNANVAAPAPAAGAVAAPPAVDAAGGVLDEDAEADPLCHRTHMVLSLKSQSRGDDFVPSDTLVNLLGDVTRNKDSILERARGSSNCAHLKEAVERPLTYYTGHKQRPGKWHRAQKLTDVWLIFKEIPELRVARGGTRTSSLDAFCPW